MKPTPQTKFFLWFYPTGKISVRPARDEWGEKHYDNADDIPDVGPHIRDDIRELSAQAVAEKRALVMHLEEPGVADTATTHRCGTIPT